MLTGDRLEMEWDAGGHFKTVFMMFWLVSEAEYLRHAVICCFAWQGGQDRSWTRQRVDTVTKTHQKSQDQPTANQHQTSTHQTQMCKHHMPKNQHKPGTPSINHRLPKGPKTVFRGGRRPPKQFLSENFSIRSHISHDNGIHLNKVWVQFELKRIEWKFQFFLDIFDFWHQILV